MAGPLFNGIYLWSTHALAEIAEIVGADPAPASRGRAGRSTRRCSTELWDPETRRFCALDVVRNERGAENTIVSFVPLLDPDLPKAQLDALVADLASASFHPDRPDGYVVPSYDLAGEGFDERRYWRGPVWINTNWLLWWGLRQHGLAAAAEEVLLSSLRLVARSGFHEYFDPFGGEGFGTGGFGWTAALTLDVIERLGPGDRARIAERVREEGLAPTPAPKLADAGTRGVDAAAAEGR